MDIYFEGIGGPSTYSLDDMRWDSCFCKSSCTTSSKGMTSYGPWKVIAETSNEPTASRYGSIGTKPKVRVKREKMITNAQVMSKRR